MKQEDIEQLKGFIDQGAEITSEDVKIKMQRLVKEYEALTRASKVDFTQHQAFEMAIEFMESLYHTYPPLKMLEDLYKHYNKKKLAIEAIDLPDVMRELGVTSYTTEDETQVKIKPVISVKTLDKENLFKWLKSVGNEDDVKNTLIFSKGEFDKNLENYLQSEGYSYEIKEDCHYKTVERIIKNRIEQAEKNEGKEELTEEEKKYSLLPPDSIAQITRLEVAEIKTKE
jgi:hypothetical protein